MYFLAQKRYIDGFSLKSRLYFKGFYNTSVLAKTTLLNAPKPKANSPPPTKHSITFIMVEVNGVISGIVANSNAPAPIEINRESQSLFLTATLISNEIEEKIAVKNIFDKKQQIIPIIPKPVVEKESFEIAPPINAPMKYAMKNSDETIKASKLFEKT